jgi:hypothetical protein
MPTKLSETEHNIWVASQFSPQGNPWIDVVNNEVDKLCVSLVIDRWSNKLVRDECAKLSKKLLGKAIVYSNGMIRSRCLQADVHRQDERDGIVERPYTRKKLSHIRSEDFRQGLRAHLKKTVPHLYERQYGKKQGKNSQ